MKVFTQSKDYNLELLGIFLSSYFLAYNVWVIWYSDIK